MPTIICPDCEARVSTLAAACPKCGRPAATKPTLTDWSPLLGGLGRLAQLAALAVILLVGAWYALACWATGDLIIP